MRSAPLWLARHRLAVALPLVSVLTFLAQPAAAAGDPQADVNAAKHALKQAQAQANNADSQLQAAQAQLAEINAQLQALQAKIAHLDRVIATDTSSLRALQAELAGDRAHLGDYVRQAYENGGSEADLVYIIEASDIATAIQRKEQIDHVTQAAQDLVNRIDSEATQAAQTLAQANAARAQLATAQAQARTTEALVAVQEQQVAQADVAAHNDVKQAQQHLSSAQAALVAEQAAIQAARATHVVYPSISGAQFTVDTNLTKPSGETAARINSFLQGTDLDGLGASFMHAQATYHVSARYFVAHAILESDWGTSAIAQNKHNLFGFNANDANPYVDATTFPSFDACIQFVAHDIAANYLSPTGAFYHGPTLRGMNVDYATDPNWAEKIASIAQTVP